MVAKRQRPGLSSSFLYACCSKPCAICRARTLLLCAIPQYFVVCRGIVRPPLEFDLEFGGPLRCLGALDFKFHKSLQLPHYG
eukprot:17448-Pleurochrysis_carterae.AAC.4